MVEDPVAEEVDPAGEEATRPGHDVVTPVGPPGRGTRMAYATVRFLVRVVATVFGRVEVRGADKVPADRPFVLAPVHRSNVDFALASLVTPQRMRYMGKDTIWRSRLLGRFVTMLGAFPVHRGTADREALRLCTQIIEGGEPLVMFPEGTRRSGPVVGEVFDGPAYVAARCGVPVVPLGIGGSEAMMPRGARFLRFSKLVLVEGDPIAPPAPTARGRVPRSGVAALTEKVRVEVQRLFDDAQARAGR
ncbi:MAG: lysophospholipid acyltransferase family protein [Acidimicrobiia bacterium]